MCCLRRLWSFGAGTAEALTGLCNWSTAAAAAGAAGCELARRVGGGDDTGKAGGGEAESSMGARSVL